MTAGPGVTDALTGVANAHAASSPLLLLGGAAPMFNQSRGSLQEMEQVDLFHRISKWSDRVPSPELVPLYLAKAFRVALSGRPGPVFLELAWDVLCNAVDESSLQMPTQYRTSARMPPDPKGVEGAMALLASAERPTCIAGSSVWWELEVQPGVIAVAVGAFADPDFPMPARSVYQHRRHRWLELPEKIERI